MTRIPRAYKEELVRVARKENVWLPALVCNWAGPSHQLDANRKRLIGKIPDPNDPIRHCVNLLSPIGRAMDEGIHTLALAYLMNPDPTYPHGFGKSILVEMLSKFGHCTSAKSILSILLKNNSKVSVVPEYRYKEEGIRNRSTSRCDIWVEVHSRSKHALFIIENKISSPETSGQLSWYEKRAKRWCKTFQQSVAFLVYLTLDGKAATSSSTQGWHSLSYLSLASALRRVWLEKPRAAGRAWLSLYIAAITGGIMGISMSDPSGYEHEIELYLGGNT